MSSYLTCLAIFLIVLLPLAVPVAVTVVDVVNRVMFRGRMSRRAVRGGPSAPLAAHVVFGASPKTKRDSIE
jgi:hypothetical protein